MEKGSSFCYPNRICCCVLSDEGEVVLVKASSEQFSEVARFSAVSGKTWNHPVLVGDILLVRNDQEMAAFRLSLTE